MFAKQASVWRSMGLVSEQDLAFFFRTTMTLTDDAVKCHTLFTAWSVWLHRKLFVWKGVANSHHVTGS
ncbi:hypothetical protein PVK06_034383 [Gossypium arboreum]|uniref:Uncharacterized protein n=1 Tax=Gossypium arboreum TaxID=29729 RepID=A0ABR0NE07_GOSAR|nr:hypothetical protein PVK06_034383 [Gossypium arboreum]